MATNWTKVSLFVEHKSTPSQCVYVCVQPLVKSNLFSPARPTSPEPPEESPVALHCLQFLIHNQCKEHELSITQQTIVM